MREKKKHYGIKLLAILALAFCAWVYFWDMPAPLSPVEESLPNADEILHN